MLCISFFEVDHILMKNLLGCHLHCDDDDIKKKSINLKANDNNDIK